MSDLKKPDIASPEAIIKGLANVCGNLNPVHIPTPTYSAGMIPNFIKRIKVRQVRLIAEEVRKIEEERTATLKTQLEQAKSLTFYSEEINTTFAQHETNRIIMREKAKQEEEKTKQEVHVTARWEALAKQDEMKVHLMYYEHKEAEMKHRIKEKEYEKEYGTSTVKGGDK